MGHDPFSPITSAQVNVLAVPAKVKPHRFAIFVSILTQGHIIGLGDISTNIQSASGPFSPKSFPEGRILFNVTASDTPRTIESFPFELNRHPQIVLAVVDGTELWPEINEIAKSGDSHNAPLEEILQLFETTETPPNSLMLRKVLVFDKPSHVRDHGNVLYVSSTEGDGNHAGKFAMSRIAGSFVVALERKVEDLRNAEIELPRSLTNSRQHYSLPANRIPSSSRTEIIGRDSPSISSGHITPASESDSTAQQDPNLANGSTVQQGNRISITSPERTASSKVRYQITLGTTYLQAGKWADALRELSEGAAVSMRSNTDYLWQANALESLVVSMILLSWTQMEFNIPRVCFAPNWKYQNGLRQYTTSEAPPSASSTNVEETGQANPATLKDIVALIPGLARTILSLYGQAFASQRDQLPRTLLLEARVRLSNLLLLANVMRADHHKPVLAVECLVTHMHLPVAAAPAAATTEIVNVLVDTAEALDGDLLPYEAIKILSAIAHSLSNLGASRKYAFHLKFLLERIVPSLVEARKLGAAEMGIHPAAGLSIQNGSTSDVTMNSQRGLRVLLSLAVKAYDLAPLLETTPVQGLIKRDPAETEHQLNESARHGLVGDVSLKLEILRLCINMCEALPDLEAGLHFNVQMLTTAKASATVSRIPSGKIPLIGQDEQARLFNNIRRTVSAANKLGMRELRARYWDDLMVRKIELMEPEGGNNLILHRPQDLSLAVSKAEDVKKDPFIYNPFSRSTLGSMSTAVMVCDEMASFSVLLQNPFQFDIEIDDIALMAEGCEFEASSHSVVLGHLCSHLFTLTGTPRSSGTLNIIGCRARVRDCYEQEFLIYPKDWHTPDLAKHKISSLRRAGRRLRTLGDGEAKSSPSGTTTLQAEALSMTVIKPQPVISVSNAPMQPSLMLLDGEETQLQVTLHNESNTATADLLLFTFEDSVTNQIKSALADKETSSAEGYELQHRLVSRPAIEWLPSTGDDTEPHILPEESKAFTFRIYGKPGLSHGIINVDYAQLQLPRSEIQDKFYTRQIQYATAMTVNSSVEISRVNALPIGDGNATFAGTELTTQKGEDSMNDNGRFLLLMDLRNMWPHPLSVFVQARLTQLPVASDPEVWNSSNSVREELQPGHITRIVLPTPRLFLSDPHAPIPTIGAKRQFVVSASKLSPEVELDSRQSFWFREELLRNITGHWKEIGTSREGEIDFRRAIRLNARMIETIKIDQVELSFSVRQEGLPDENHNVKQISHSTFLLHVDHFYTLAVSIRNRSHEALHLLLRLQPSLLNQPYHIALDLSKRLVWSGLLQRALHPFLQPGETSTAEVGITPLATGHFEVGANVEELLPYPLHRDGNRDLKTPTRHRRIWHAKQPCHLDVI